MQYLHNQGQRRGQSFYITIQGFTIQTIYILLQPLSKKKEENCVEMPSASGVMWNVVKDEQNHISATSLKAPGGLTGVSVGKMY